MAEHPHVVAVNVGRAAPLAVGDRVVASGIVKHAATGPVAVGPLGVAGDEQADRVNHGGPYKAVYAYASEDAAFWEAELGRPIEPAAFGENLTLAGVDVTGARIGERWRIGSVRARGLRAARAVLEARRADGRPALPQAVRRRRAPRRLPLGPDARHPAGRRRGARRGTGPTTASASAWSSRSRCATAGAWPSSTPARPYMNPELLAWLYRAA